MMRTKSPCDWTYRTAVIGTFHSSPGMVSEAFTLVRATGLTKVGEGGGLSNEDITVHRIAMADVTAFVAERRAAGVAMDVKMLVLLAADILRG